MRSYKDLTPLFVDLKAGKTEAFEYIFRTYYPRLRNYASRFVTDQADLEDILQDCFVHLWERRQSLSAISVSSLLFTMVRNGCINYLRHKTMVDNCLAETLAHMQGSEQLYAMDLWDNADSHLMYQDLTQEIENVMDTLSPRCKEIFTMSRFEGLRNKEIAERLHISVKVVEKHITQALTTFKKRFSKDKSDRTHLLLLWYIVMANTL